MIRDVWEKKKKNGVKGVDEWTKKWRGREGGSERH